jgi:protein SCO1/2
MIVIKTKPMLALVVLAWGLSTGAVEAQDPSFTESAPVQLAGMEVVEQLDQQLPLDLEFTDQDGKSVRLGEYFDGQRPVILTLNYYRCPMLCGLTLNAVVDGLKEIDWTAGDEFRLLTVSFEPSETRELAYQKRQSYLAHYGRNQASAGWDFLVGPQGSIDELLDATGFPIRWNEKSSEWIHPACIMILTPDGRLSRYLYGVYYNPQTLRLSLVEASEGKIGTTVDQVLLWCFHYDPAAGSYQLAAIRLAQAGGTLTLVALLSLLTILWRRDLRRKRSLGTTAIQEPDEATWATSSPTR